MSKVKIITDSCSDLPAAIIEKYGIEFLNIEVNIDNKIYYDRADLEPKDFYNLIKDQKQVPKTSRLTPDKFKNIYQKYLNDYDHILVIAFSSKLSGILESAVIAKKEMAAEKITIIDSKAASIGQGILVYQAAKMLKNGQKLKEVVNKTMADAAKMEHIFAVGDLEMLKRGGRISKAKALMANVLNIKPILHILDGEILPHDKVRGKKRMISYLLKEIKTKADQPENQVIGLAYSEDQEAALKLKKEIEKEFEPKEVFLTEIGAAVGSHAGPGTLAIVFKNSKEIAKPKLY
ncbi:DegV family protein [Halanaerobium praevalens]|uniref:DegV family protein n=1 Tax=Halanaerobium praevalens (strain ATCC 33744 / DSM 2228 / GSL) TaxID=572479 RepID=E3DMF0_HALPG|nr:DegV family protein [Halanaerobium praevalens]ADO77358.1 degV family protein [Halanaerobium praevalens DSM 2228]